MKNITSRNLITYIGTSLPSNLNTTTFKLFTISHLFNTTSNEFEIKNIVQVKCGSNILNYKIIKTPKGLSCEGYKLTGTKLFAKGVITCSIQCNSTNPLNNLRILTYNIPFIESLELNNFYPFNFNNITPAFHIIDITASKLDTKTIYITLICYMNVIS